MNWKLTGLVSGIALTLVLGLLLGMNFLGNQDDTSNETAQTYSKQAANNIAVVNLDNGIEQKEETQNYATPIIESLDESYTVVPFKMAQDGLKSGVYDAVVCIPSDFSRKAASVNNLYPEKIEIEYEVNSMLAEEKYIETYGEVVDLQSYINSTLSYAYIYSIYEEFHDAQGNMKKLLKNDKKDMAEVGRIKAYNFGNNLDLSDIPKIKLNLKEQNFDTYVNNVSNLGSDMSNVYMNSYNKAKNDYANTAQKVSDEVDAASSSAVKLIEDANAWDSDIAAWRSGENAKVDQFNANTDIANGYTQEYNTKVDMLCEYITWLKEIDVAPYEKYTTKLESWYEGLKDYHDDPENNKLPKKPKSLKKLNRDAKAVRTKVAANTTLQAIAVNQEKEKLAIDTIPTSEKFTAPPSTINLDTTDLKGDLAKLRTASLSYDPMSYMTQSDRDTVNGIIGNYGNEVMKLKSSADSTQSKNLTMMTSAYDKYNLHVGDLRTDVSKAYDKEHKSVDNMLKNFIAIKTANSIQNRTLMKDFVSKAPNSKTDASVNTDLVDFIAEPVSLVNGDIRDAQSDQTKLINAFLIGGAVLLLALFALSMAMGFRKKKQMR